MIQSLTTQNFAHSISAATILQRRRESKIGVHYNSRIFEVPSINSMGFSFNLNLSLLILAGRAQD